MISVVSQVVVTTPPAWSLDVSASAVSLGYSQSFLEENQLSIHIYLNNTKLNKVKWMSLQDFSELLIC